MVENKLYVLDKYLPLATIDRWHNRWHRCRFSNKKVEKAKGTSMESVELNSLLSTVNSSEPDTVKMAKEMKELLNIHGSLDNPKRDSLTIMKWKMGAILYDDDEIVNYSLAQRLKTEMSNEMIDINRVTNLAVDWKKDDLIFRVEL
jgi:predicted transglutaminase-like protease